MIEAASFILAKSTDTVGTIFGAIVVILMVISSVASAIQKQKEELKRKKVREQIEQSMARGRSGAAPPKPSPTSKTPTRNVQLDPRIAMRVPKQVQPQQRKKFSKPANKKAARSQPPRLAPPPVPVAEEPAPHRTHLSTALETQSDAMQVSSQRGIGKGTPTAGALHRWLRPETLRTQFILTEILSPPLSMRKPIE